MDLILYSKCIKQLNKKKSKTSSEYFEIEFLEVMSKYFENIIVLSEQALKIEKNKKVNITLLCTNKKSSVKELSNKITLNLPGNSNEKYLLMFGYDLANLQKLKKLRKKVKAKLLSYTFDTHRPSIENKKIIKRFLLDLYFKKGIKELNNTDGIILLNKKAVKELNINIPYHVSKIGFNTEEIFEKKFLRQCQDPFKIMYAGSLEEHNKIKEMVQSITLLKNQKVQLDIYGEGKELSYVMEISKEDERINYKGLVSQEEIDQLIKEYDLLLNLRDPNDYVQKFAFPSKLIKFMASGIPVLTTNLISEYEFKDSTFVVDDLLTETIQKKINYIIDNPLLQREKSIKAMNYIKDKFEWNQIAEEMIVFFNKI